MVNNFLTEVLGYLELEEIKTEYAIKGRYADYVIQLNKKQRIIVEVKAYSIDLNNGHIRQALDYAANEAVNWVLLTNGRQYQLSRVIFGKPMTHKVIYDLNLKDKDDFKKATTEFEYITKKGLSTGALEKYWKRFQASEPINLCKYLYKPNIIKILKRRLKQEANLNFSEQEIFNSIHKIVTTKLEVKKPRYSKT